MRALLSFKKIFILITLIFLFAGVGGYLLLSDQFRNPNSLQSEVPVRVGVASAGGEFSSLVIIAYEKGYFAQEGLNIILTKERSGVSALEKLQAEELDIVTVSDFAFVNNSFVNPLTKIIATIDAADAVEMIVRRGEAIGTPSDLKGKKIGVVPQTAAAYVLGRFLTMNNLSLNDVEIIDITYDNAEEAIRNGFVDAVIINNPHAYTILNSLDGNAVAWSAQYGQKLFFNAISNDYFVSARPTAIESFLRALIRAENFITYHPRESKLLVQKSFSLSEEYVNSMWSSHDFSVRLDQALLPTIEAQARWLLLYEEKNEIKIPNYLSRVYIDGLVSVAPESVTVIR